VLQSRLDSLLARINTFFQRTALFCYYNLSLTLTPEDQRFMPATKLDIAKVFAQLPQFLTQSEFVSIELEGARSGGRGNIHIDGKSCASVISLWVNGHCEVALLALSSEQKNTERYEFETEIAAVETITQALKAALEYA
jgi:hypothetical protein